LRCEYFKKCCAFHESNEKRPNISRELEKRKTADLLGHVIRQNKYRFLQIFMESSSIATNYGLPRKIVEGPPLKHNLCSLLYKKIEYCFGIKNMGSPEAAFLRGTSAMALIESKIEKNVLWLIHIRDWTGLDYP